MKALIIGAVVVLAIAIFSWQYEYGTQRTVTFTVKSLDDQSTGNGHKYLVFATDGQVYENTDAWLHGKTDSSNLEGTLNVGSTYRCPVYGWRNTVFSSYPDLLDGCKQVSGHA